MKTYHFFLQYVPARFAQVLTIITYTSMVISILYGIPSLLEPMLYWGR